MSEKNKERLAGVVGLIALVAIITEMVWANFSPEAIVGGIKDIAGIILDVSVLLVALFALRPKKEAPFDFDKELDTRLNEWTKINSNMISTKGNIRDLYMKTDTANFFNKSDASEKNGRFVKIEKKDKKIGMTFSLNKGLIFGTGPDESEESKKVIETAGENISSYINANYSNAVNVKYEKSAQNILITLRNDDESKEIVDLIMNIIDTMYQAFLVCSSTRK